MSMLFSIVLAIATLGYCFMHINYSEAFSHKHWILGNIVMLLLLTCSAYYLTNASN